MDLTFTIGSEQANIIPESDRVRCRLIDIQPNKYQPDARLDFTFQIMDPEYDNEDMDEDTVETIRAMSQSETKYYERVNKPPAGEEMSKGLRIYKLIKWMNGGRDIETGERVELGDYLRKDYLIDFTHVDKKGGPPDFAVVRDDKGNPVQKAAILKLRPAQRKRPQAANLTEAIANVEEKKSNRGRQTALPETDDDLFDDDVVE